MREGGQGKDIIKVKGTIEPFWWTETVQIRKIGSKVKLSLSFKYFMYVHNNSIILGKQSQLFQLNRSTIGNMTFMKINIFYLF